MNSGIRGIFDSYKQNKFNLLREQSEGYSKLTAELTSGLGPSHSPITGRAVEPYVSIEDRARSVWEKVISLIGYFDLDPNRALDVILDVFSVHLATHYTFFLAFLSFSPWSAPPQTTSPIATTTGSPYQGLGLLEVLSLAEVKSGSRVNTSPTTGNAPRVLAQVLGFKFAYYQVSSRGTARFHYSHIHSLVTRCYGNHTEKPISDSRYIDTRRFFDFRG